MTAVVHRLVGSPSPRPWGGGRFGSVDGVPVGELWVSGDEARLPDGRTLAAAGWGAARDIMTGCWLALLG